MTHIITLVRITPKGWDPGWDQYQKDPISPNGIIYNYSGKASLEIVAISSSSLSRVTAKYLCALKMARK